MRSDILLLAAATLAIAGCTGTGTSTGSTASAGSAASNRTDPMALKVTGETQRCIPNRNNVSTTPAGQNVLMFRTGANSWFRNELRSACTPLRDNRALVFRNASSQHCELDLFDVVDLSTRTNFGTCSLGRFTPVEVPRGARF
jgi:hypothetical protein